MDVNFHVVFVDHLLLDVLVHVSFNLWFVGYLVVQSYDSLGGSKIILTKFVEVLVIEVLDEDLSTMVFFMMSRIPFSLVSWFSLSQLEGSEKFSAEIVRRICSWRSWMDNILMLMVLMQAEMRGPSR